MSLPHDHRTLELLAPAGDFTCARAAVENGADAVYFGLDQGFNARARAGNISLQSLPDLMNLLHERGVRGYLTLNTLVFTNELLEFEKIVRQVAHLGVDAVLVQDLGAARLIRRICPDLPIHASTQMTLTSAECIRVAQQLGIERVVLARELSIKEIRQIAREDVVPLEVFAHGALCVAYSGQCLTSESLGGRSANRGQCAQACRLPYEIICDGQEVDLGDVKYLLSPQDLAAFDLIPELIDAGVTSIKIEGRLKTPEYVANIVKRYRKAIDLALADRVVQLDPQEVEEMELSFSRGFSPGWLKGCDHKMLVPGRSSAKRGVLLGTVHRVRGSRVGVRLQRALKPGDGIVFEGDRTADAEQGGRVYEVWRGRKLLKHGADRGEVELAFGRQSIRTSELYEGQQVWKTDDPQLTKRLRRTFAGQPKRRLPIDLHVTVTVGQPLRLSVNVKGTETIDIDSKHLPEPAKKHPVTQQQLCEQLGRLGTTPFQLNRLSAEIVGNPMVPLSVLGQLRHELIDTLTRRLREKPLRRIESKSVLPELQPALASNADREAPQLTVLCRSLAQLQTLLDLGQRDVIVDFADIREYADAVEMARRADTRLALATPRIHKPSETGILRSMHRCNPDAILARNLAAISYFVDKGIPVVADYSLNVSNELTARFIHDFGVDHMTVSYDLNCDQLRDLVAVVPPAWLQVVIHQHMPMFHMEHCVFCAVLSPGTNKTNCGRPCDDHQVYLRDRMGMQHQLTADVGCRNTLFNAQPQSAAELVPTLLSQGVSSFRVELLDDDGHDQVRRVVHLYSKLIRGEVSSQQVWRDLKAMNRVGVTRGTMEHERDPLAII